MAIGGISAGFSLIDGWAAPDAVATAAALPVLAGDPDRIGQATAWLRATQQEGGSFPIPGSEHSKIPTLTRILSGMIEAQQVFGGFDDVIGPLASFLVAGQGDDGDWGSGSSAGVALDTYTAWALMDADRVLPDAGFGDAGLRGAVRILQRIRRNGWIVNCSYEGEPTPSSFSLGSVLHGKIGAYRHTGDIRFLDTALLTGWSLVAARRADGALPGRMDSHWAATVPWTSLTGNAQIAICWLQLFQETSEPEFLEAAKATNAFLRRSLSMTGEAAEVGAVRASFPINRGDKPYTYSALAGLLTLKSLKLESAVDAQQISRLVEAR